jgi:hypothetical protein
VRQGGYGGRRPALLLGLSGLFQPLELARGRTTAPWSTMTSPTMMLPPGSNRPSSAALLGTAVHPPHPSTCGGDKKSDGCEKKNRRGVRPGSDTAPVQ